MLFVSVCEFHVTSFAWERFASRGREISHHTGNPLEDIQHFG